MERPVVVAREARVVEKAEFLDQLERRVGEVGRRRPEAQRLDAEPFERLPGAFHIRSLVVARLVARVDVRVGVVRDLVAALEDRFSLLRKRFDGVARHEERRGQLPLAEKPEDARDSDPGAELATVKHGRRDTVVAEPHGKRVEVEREADGALRHGYG